MLDIDQPVAEPIAFENIGIRLLADLALELFPSVADEVLFLFLYHFLLQPSLQTLVVDVLARSIALARVKQRVLRGRRVVPANFALNVRSRGRVDDTAVDLYSLFFKLLSQTIA